MEQLTLLGVGDLSAGTQIGHPVRLGEISRLIADIT